MNKYYELYMLKLKIKVPFNKTDDNQKLLSVFKCFKISNENDSQLIIN